MIRVLEYNSPYKQSKKIAFFVIGCGAVHESMATQGYTHFVEHVLYYRLVKLLKGSLLKGVREISARTYQNRVVFEVGYQSFNKKSFDVIAQTVFSPTPITQEELREAKLFVLDEIAHLQTTAEFKIDRIKNKKLFGNHPLGYEIFGTQSVIKKLTLQKIDSFIKSHISKAPRAIFYNTKTTKNTIVAQTQLKSKQYHGFKGIRTVESKNFMGVYHFIPVTSPTHGVQTWACTEYIRKYWEDEMRAYFKKYHISVTTQSFANGIIVSCEYHGKGIKMKDFLHQYKQIQNNTIITPSDISRMKKLTIQDLKKEQYDPYADINAVTWHWVNYGSKAILGINKQIGIIKKSPIVSGVLG